ncbi:MAG: hypothetical protein ACPG77_18700, partial [Nannocystaceae bacterium]
MADDGRTRVRVGGYHWSVRRWGSCIRNDQATVVALHGFAGTGDDFAPLLCGPHAIPGPWLTCD